MIFALLGAICHQDTCRFSPIPTAPIGMMARQPNPQSIDGPLTSALHPAPLIVLSLCINHRNPSRFTMAQWHSADRNQEVEIAKLLQ